MTAEFESDLPQDGEHREGLRKALGENADAGYRARLRAAFLRGDLSEVPESREAGEGRNPAAAGDSPVLPAQSASNGPSPTPATPQSPSAQRPLAQRPPAGDPAQQPHDGRTPAELRSMLGANLRQLADRYPSVAELCRQLGVNRTQFNRYLSGESFPRPDVLDRICRFFDVDARILLKPLEEIPAPRRCDLPESVVQFLAP